MITKRTDTTKNSDLENLPVDLLLMLFQHLALNDWRDLMALFLSSPNFYALFSQQHYMKKLNVKFLHSATFVQFRVVNLASINRVLMANYYRDHLKFPELNAALVKCGLPPNENDYYNKNVLEKVEQRKKLIAKPLSKRNSASNFLISLAIVMMLYLIDKFVKNYMPFLCSEKDLETSAIPFAVFVGIIASLIAHSTDKRLPVLVIPEVQDYEDLKSVIAKVNHRRSHFFRSNTINMKLFASKMNTSISDLKNNNVFLRLNMGRDLLSLISNYGDILCENGIEFSGDNYLAKHRYVNIHKALVDHLITCYSIDTSPQEKVEALSEIALALICSKTKTFMTKPVLLSTGHFVDESVAQGLTHCPVTQELLQPMRDAQTTLINEIAKHLPRITKEVTEMANIANLTAAPSAISLHK